MPKFRLTKTALQRLALPETGKRETHYDTETSRLALRVTAASAKTFYVVRRKPGGVDWVKLDSFPEMAVEQARRAALEVLAEYAAGGNVAEARRELKGEPTFAEALDEYLAKKRNRNGQPLAEGTRRDYTDVVRLYCSELAGKKLSAITEVDIQAAQRKAEKKSPAQSARLVAVTSAVFRWTQKEKLFSGVIPTGSANKPVIKARERFAQAAELTHKASRQGQAMTGASLAIIGQSLNHKSVAATQVYARISTDPVRLAMSTATSAMLEAAGLKAGAEVVPLKRGAA